MESHGALKKNIISLVILQGTNYLLPLISLPYLVRVLGPEKFGLIAFVQAIIQYFTMVVDYGFNWSATKKLQRIVRTQLRYQWSRVAFMLQNSLSQLSPESLCL